MYLEHISNDDLSFYTFVYFAFHADVYRRNVRRVKNLMHSMAVVKEFNVGQVLMQLYSENALVRKHKQYLCICLSIRKYCFHIH